MTSLTDPDRILALGYASRHVREKLRALWAIDEAMAQNVATTQDPLIAQIKLKWWSERLSAGDVKASPLINALALAGVDVSRAAQMAEGWAHMLDEFPLSQSALSQYGQLRGKTLFELAGMAPEQAEAGAGWALVDFAFHCSDEKTAQAALSLAAGMLSPDVIGRISKSHKCVALLAYFARHDCEAGLGKRIAPGSPRRMWLALSFMMFGKRL